jgi:hypothetical protein
MPLNGWKQKLCAPTQLLLLRSFYMTTCALGLVAHWPLLSIIHICNDVIHYLTNHFILKHINSTIYYPQGNGQVEFTNKVFCTLFTKLVKITTMIRMNTCPQFYFLIEPFSRLEWITLPLNLFMGCTCCYLWSTYYHPNQDKIMIQHMLKL